MLLVAHIVIALGGIVNASLLAFWPSKNRFRAAYGLLALTIGSGTYLAIGTHASLTSTCLSGLVYTGLVAVLLVFGYKKAVQKATSKD